MAGELISTRGAVESKYRNEGEAHERAIAGVPRVGEAGVGIPGTDEAGERFAGGDADIEAGAGATVGAVLPPTDEAGGEVMSIEARAADEAIGEGERHRGVVRPLARGEIERTAAGHLGMKGLGVAASELQRGAEGVTDGEAEESAMSAVADGRIEARCNGQR